MARLTGRGATTARILCWAMPAGLVAAFVAGLAWWVALAVGVAAWVGCLPPWWRSLTLGRDPAQGTYLAQAARHAGRGVLWGLPMALVLALAGATWWPMLLAGATCWPVYELAYRIKPTRGTEIGESIFGAAMMAALAIA